MSRQCILVTTTVVGALLGPVRAAHADPPTSPPPTPATPPGGATPLHPTSPSAVHATGVERRTPALQGERQEPGFHSIFSAPYSPTYSGPWLFDRFARDALVAPTLATQTDVSTASDGLLFASFLAPIALSGVYALGGDARFVDFAWLAAVDIGALAVDIAATEVFKYTMGRERPYATAAHLSHYCANPLRFDELACNVDRNASFLSGHSSTTFTGAGLVCAQSAFLGRGPDAWDGVACGFAIAGATTAAMLRIIADRHYATDTMAGSTLGLVIGLVLPSLLFLSPIAPLPVGGSLRTPVEQLNLAPAAIGAGAGLVVGMGTSILLAIALQGRRGPLRHDVHLGPVGVQGAVAFGLRAAF